MLNRTTKILNTLCATALAITLGCAATPNATAAPTPPTHKTTTTPPAEPTPGFTHITPTRIHDSRTTGQGQLPADHTRTISLAQLANTMPQNTTAATITITAVNPTDHGYLTVWPHGQQRPTISTLNYAPGENTANTITVPLSKDHTINVYTHAATDLLIDVIGFVDTTSPLKPIPGHRVLDTRTTHNTPPASRFIVDFAGLEDRPDEGLQGATINVTVINPQTPGTIHAWATGTNKPTTSAASYPNHRITSTTMMVPMGFENTIEIANSTPGHIIVDVLGWVARNDNYTVHPATTIYDTTTNTPCQTPTTTNTHTITTATTTPCTTTATTAWVSVTVTGTNTPGYATVTSTDHNPTTTSTILYQPHTPRTALIPVRLNNTGHFQVYTHNTAHVTATLQAHTT